MIGMVYTASLNIFPFIFIYAIEDLKYLRFNKVKIPEQLQININNNKLRNLIEDLKILY
jgi:hypothetical protein